MGKYREKSGKTLQKLETIRKPTKNEGVWASMAEKWKLPFMLLRFESVFPV